MGRVLGVSIEGISEDGKAHVSQTDADLMGDDRCGVRLRAAQSLNNSVFGERKFTLLFIDQSPMAPIGIGAQGNLNGIDSQGGFPATSVW